MAKRILHNFLELAYSPICNYDFALIKNDPHFQNLAKESTLYIIAQRPELTFEALHAEFIPPYQVELRFEIRQKQKDGVLHCRIPLYQESFARDPEKEIKFHFEYALPKPDPVPQSFPQGNIRNLLFTYHDGTFIGWLSPENLIQNYCRGVLKGEISGPIEDFIRYPVHYVGKATEQRVWKRLTGHTTLQEILSLEYPLHYSTLPTHEITLLFLKFREAFQIHNIASGDPITSDMIDSLLGRNLPSSRTISLDAEKALISAMQPRYNKEFYKSYPKSKDGLYPLELDEYTFRIHSPVTLVYDNGMIHGAMDYLKADAIVVKKGSPLKVLSNSRAPHP